MSLSFKQRIATHFMLATAIIIALVFGIVYFIVQQTVYQNIDNDLSFEANKHTSEIKIVEYGIHFINADEFEENEHREVQVNPVFIQLMNSSGVLMDKSPNLKEKQLIFKSDNNQGQHFSTTLNNRAIRQVQIPVQKDNKIAGYIVAAMSLESSLMVLENLRNTLLLSYPIVLIGLFFISSFLAGRSIIPVVSIINTTNRITKNNLNERVELPQNDDELYDLSSSINGLLSRIEDALEREKQFTSDASHELRTPLSVLRGTLEVLVRKERSMEEYQEKIKYSLTEIDRMSSIIDQLLELARFDANPELSSKSAISLNGLVQQTMVQQKPNCSDKNITVNIQQTNFDDNVKVNGFYARLIIDNILSNAVKYSRNDTTIEINLTADEHSSSITIIDQGLGIKPDDMKQIFTPFFRSDALQHKEIKGVGLGLSIAQKAAKAINADIEISSEHGVGTTVKVNFKEILRIH
jgi:signal transduction histidine kinase